MIIIINKYLIISYYWLHYETFWERYVGENKENSSMPYYYFTLKIWLWAILSSTSLLE